jgi:myosin heavy subunit
MATRRGWSAPRPVSPSAWHATGRRWTACSSASRRTGSTTTPSTASCATRRRRSTKPARTPWTRPTRLKDAAKNEQQSGGPDPKKRDEAGKSQEKVNQKLEDLIQMLDQGQDTWSMKRNVEKMLQEQKDLRERTNKAAQQNTGRSLQELTPQERKELEQLSADQKSLAEKAAENIQKMMDAEQKVRKNDPAAADSMSQAAKQAQRDQLQQKMEQASQQIQQNQNNNAQQQQDKAVESLQNMLEQMQNTAKNRDEILRRKLASIIESLEALIKDQTAQLDVLKEAKEKNAVAGLDKGMVRLHQNTLGVLDEASQGPRELAPVAALIQEAAAAQSNAVTALRVEPINADEAEGQETISLDKLNEARASPSSSTARRRTARRPASGPSSRRRTPRSSRSRSSCARTPRGSSRRSRTAAPAPWHGPTASARGNSRSASPRSTRT